MQMPAVRPADLTSRTQVSIVSAKSGTCLHCPRARIVNILGERFGFCPAVSCWRLALGEVVLTRAQLNTSPY